MISPPGTLSAPEVEQSRAPPPVHMLPPAPPAPPEPPRPPPPPAPPPAEPPTLHRRRTCRRCLPWPPRPQIRRRRQFHDHAARSDRTARSRHAAGSWRAGRATGPGRAPAAAMTSLPQGAAARRRSGGAAPGALDAAEVRRALNLHASRTSVEALVVGGMHPSVGAPVLQPGAERQQCSEEDRPFTDHPSDLSGSRRIC